MSHISLVVPPPTTTNHISITYLDTPSLSFASFQPIHDALPSSSKWSTLPLPEDPPSPGPPQADTSSPFKPSRRSNVAPTDAESQATAGPLRTDPEEGPVAQAPTNSHFLQRIKADAPSAVELRNLSSPTPPLPPDEPWRAGKFTRKKQDEFLQQHIPTSVKLIIDQPFGKETLDVSFLSEATLRVVSTCFKIRLLVCRLVSKCVHGVKAIFQSKTAPYQAPSHRLPATPRLPSRLGI